MPLQQQRKNTLQQNPFAHHQRLITVSDDVIWQVYIGLHQFDDCQTQVKINVNDSCFLPYSRYLASSSFSITVPRCTEHRLQSAVLPV